MTFHLSKLASLESRGKMNRADTKRLQNNGAKSKRSCPPENKRETPALPEPERGKGETYRRICAWCGLVMQQGMEPVSHGICRDCADFFFDEVQIAEDPFSPFCEVCSGPCDKEKCLPCRIDSSRGEMSIGQTILEGNHQE